MIIKTTRRQFLYSAASVFAGILLINPCPVFCQTGDMPEESAISDIKYSSLDPFYHRYGSWVSKILPENGKTRIFGWFACENLEEGFYAPPAIYCIINQSRVWKTQPDRPRPDVRKSYPDVPENCGFDISLELPENCLISVWVLDNFGRLAAGREGVNPYEQKEIL